MRIIGGRAKGRRLSKPSRSHMRPTSDMLKEALFNIIPDVSGKKFLDLFAGTGSVGLEALSRSAVRVVFVEKDPLCVEAIRDNLRKCRFEDGYDCFAMSAETALKMLGRRGERFDVVFLDPPYEKGLVTKTLDFIANTGVLSEDGTVVVQRSTREKIESETCRLISDDERKYGDTIISFWKLK